MGEALLHWDSLERDVFDPFLLLKSFFLQKIFTRATSKKLPCSWV